MIPVALVHWICHFRLHGIGKSVCNYKFKNHHVKTFLTQAAYARSLNHIISGISVIQCLSNKIWKFPYADSSITNITTILTHIISQRKKLYPTETKVRQLIKNSIKNIDIVIYEQALMMWDWHDTVLTSILVLEKPWMHEKVQHPR